VFWWLASVIVALLIWGALWKRSLALGFGVLLGVLIAWVLSWILRPYVTGMETIPIWLPPLPLATIAVALFVYGALVWFRGNDALPKGKQEDHDHSHGHH
jgi:uncharacterized membrane protein YccC